MHNGINNCNKFTKINADTLIIRCALFSHYQYYNI